ncbi:hypothetical protein QVD17_04517 [Tagetes erecta]|uniref:Uncharacterized protein n=1 Tax=Tagetes erecta TaxID=13708 RepID=A0AAD8PAS7_TARER|nr:hypothetical protein QVD17_04517 [Tagetes erecta]
MTNAVTVYLFMMVAFYLRRAFVYAGWTEMRVGGDDGAASTVRDINVASRILKDVIDATINNLLFYRYKKFGCSFSSLVKESED